MRKLFASIAVLLLMWSTTAFGQATDVSGIVGEKASPVAGISLDKRFSAAEFGMLPAGSPCKIYPGTSARLIRLIDGDKAIVSIGLVSGGQAKAFFKNAEKRFTSGLAKEDRQCMRNIIIGKRDWESMVAANAEAGKLPIKK